MENILINNKTNQNSEGKWITVMKKKKKETDGYNKSRTKENDNNVKKMLCNNILEYGTCHYGDKCMYAHSLSEQNVDPIRKKAYDIILDKEKISYKPDKELSRTLLQLTKVCDDCDKKKCSGGYNCKYGVIDKKYQICADDLRYGICYNETCNCIHLTNKGLIPLNCNNKNETIRVIKYTDKNKKINIPHGTLITEDFFLKLSGGNKQKKNDYDSDDSENEFADVERIKKYLNENSDSDKSCDESIFD